VKKIVVLYDDRLGINNVQIINSSGREAQQDVFHIHFHIVPRKKGDGQNVVWRTHPEWTEKFDQMLERIK
jgi:histidine triad (HIT) family protein